GTSRPTAASRLCGRPPSCSVSCGNPSPPAPARRATSTTAAAAAAWRPSSSPDCRWTDRTPSVSAVSVRGCSLRSGTSPRRPRTTPAPWGSRRASSRPARCRSHSSPPRRAGPPACATSRPSSPAPPAEPPHDPHHEETPVSRLSTIAEANPWRQNPWFESVAEARRRARKKLPKSVYMALVGGSEAGITLDDNQDAYNELAPKPHVIGAKPERSLETTVMGQPISMPVMISPTGVQAVTPDGEVDVARAAAARGTAMGLSSFASQPIEEVVAANPQTFFQVYWLGGKEKVLERLERAKSAGASGVILTTDWSFSMGRDWGSPAIPEKLDFKAMVTLAPQLAVRPRWTMEW